MNLHEHKEEFEELIAIVADYIGVPADAVRRDYYIVQMMQNLQNSRKRGNYYGKNQDADTFG